MMVMINAAASGRCSPSIVLRGISSSTNRIHHRRANPPNLLLQRKPTISLRYLSSSSSTNRNKKRSNSNSKNAFTNTYGIPFSVSPDTALETFRDWAHNTQGLSSNRWIFNNVAITAAYVPVWSFDLNVRYRKGNAVVSPPPLLEQAYGTNKSNSNNIVYIPGMAAYAGYSYRRSLVDPIHSTSLLFLLHSDQQSRQSKLQPFHA